MKNVKPTKVILHTLMFEFQLQKIIAKLMTHVRPLDQILPLHWQHGGHILRKDTWKELPLHKQPNDNYC